MNKIVWPHSFDHQAKREGWTVFGQVGGPHDGKLRIQRIDDMQSVQYELQEEYKNDYSGPDTMFDSDEAAIRYVRKAAKAGEKHAILALELHDKAIKSFV